MSWANIAAKNLPQKAVVPNAVVQTSALISKPSGDDGLIDIGANLTHKSFQADMTRILNDAFEQGVKSIIITGTSISKSKAAISLCKRYNGQPKTPQLYCTVGIHPHDAKSAVNLKQTETEIRTLVSQNSSLVVAIGECGLDYNRMFSTKTDQENVFKLQLRLSNELNLPLFLHERDAFDDFYQMLKENNGKGVVHCFTGKKEHLLLYLELGMSIGITGWIADDRRGKALYEMVRSIPLDKLMVETDAPFLTPRNMPFKVTSNEPQYLRWVVRKVAETYDTSETIIQENTTRNACKMFMANMK